MASGTPWFDLPARTAQCNSVVVIGAGLAGCHTAFELAQRNVHVQLIDGGDGIATGASGNHVGIVKPFVTRDPGKAAQFYAAAFEYLLNRLERRPNDFEQVGFNACGVLQLVENNYPTNPAYQICTPVQASQIAGTTINSNAIFFSRAGYLNPRALCAAIVRHPNIELKLSTTVSNIQRKDSRWLLEFDRGSPVVNCETVILANGEHLTQFEQTRTLPITAARGQTSRFELDTLEKNTNTPDGNNRQADCLRTVVTGTRYAIPQNTSVVVGATFSRDNTSIKLASKDHEHNAHELKTLLPSIKIRHNAVSGFCGIRATTPDRLPVVGPVPDFEAYRRDYELIRHGLPANRFPQARYQDNLFVIGGFGSRGIVSSPYCAALLADYISNIKTPSKETTQQTDLSHWSTLLHPGRFIIRELKRFRPLVY